MRGEHPFGVSARLPYCIFRRMSHTAALADGHREVVSSACSCARASGRRSRVRRFRDMGDACLEVVAVVGAVGAVEVHVPRLHESGLVREYLAVPFSREVGVRRLAMREHARLARNRMRRQRVSDRVLTAQSAVKVAHCHHARLTGTGRSRVLDGVPPTLSPSKASLSRQHASQSSSFIALPAALNDILQLLAETPPARLSAPTDSIAIS